jgi:uncharacterized membrane protein
MEVSFDAGVWWSYALVFLAAAVPVVEVLVVIPAGIVAGMSPAATVVLALAGNTSTVVLVAVAGEQMLTWWQQRRPACHERPSRRTQRARGLAQRWGVPGLAFLAPVTTGTHLATLAALTTGATTRRVVVWMTVGLVFWSVAVAVLTLIGVDAVR